MSHVIACIFLFNLRGPAGYQAALLAAGMLQLYACFIFSAIVFISLLEPIAFVFIGLVCLCLVGLVVVRLGIAYEVRRATPVGLDWSWPSGESPAETKSMMYRDRMKVMLDDPPGTYEKWKEKGWLWALIEPSPYSHRLFRKAPAAAKG